jgi:polyisoprenyl-phosphate glycosyltransferase
MSADGDLGQVPQSGGAVPRLISVVVPVYNEAEGLRAFHKELAAVLDRIAIPAEIWFANDGSTDATARQIREIASRDPRVGAIELSRNFGHQMALTAALDQARGDVIICMDGDGQHPPALIPALLQRHADGYDLVLTRRRGQQGWFKRKTSEAFYRVMNTLSRTKIVPGAADFRLMTRQVVDALRQTREYHRFLRGLVQWVGFYWTIVEFDPPPRLAGTSKFTLAKMLRFAGDAVFSFSLVPLRLSIFLGAFLVLLAAAELSWTFYLIFSGRVHELVPGWTSLIFSVLGIGGVQLITMGIIGQYVGMIFEQVKNRPLYVLRGKPIVPRVDAPHPESTHVDA